MCDLWKYTRETASPEKTIPRQIDRALQEIQSAGHPVQWIKLYNAGSFFDTGAVPPSDYPEIAQRIQSIPKIIVESHPRLIGDRTWHFQKLLDPLQPGRLEVAMGLETVHPDVLNKLNKRMTTADYADATRRLKEHGCDVRAFVLIKPPFLDEAQALEWACRSLDQAFDWGVDVVTLIPVRFGNGALETLAARGQFHPPRLETLLAAFDYGRGLNRGRVFLDLWDLERLIPDPVVLNEMRVELERRNLRSET
jgi:radical SAM enzyme (TIGR01210 family)